MEAQNPNLRGKSNKNKKAQYLQTGKDLNPDPHATLTTEQRV